ncbi:MAG: M23 family metallopeptidase, partial [Deinococcales bacterium]
LAGKATGVDFLFHSLILTGFTHFINTLLNAAHTKALSTVRLWTKPFIFPRPPVFTSPFAQARFYKKNDVLNYHYGQDIAGKIGDPIYATNDGIVEVAGVYPIRGGLTGINHGAGLVSLYFHQSQILVKIGQRVKRGQLIGKVGNTGFSTAPHLHWEMRIRAEATDPKQWVDRLFPF